MTAIIMAVLLICSAMVTVAAAGGEETLTAPEFAGIQTRENETDSSKSDVRFLSTVNSLDGDKLGYEVVATFVNADGVTKNITYKGAKTEGTTVYSSVLVNGISKNASDLTEGAIGVYVFTITGVPNAYDVVFTVKTYLVSGTDTYESVETFTYDVVGGKGLEKTYTQEFDKGAASLSQTYGLVRPYQQNMALKIDNNKLYVPDIGWASTAKQQYWAAIVDRANFQNAVKDIKGTASEAYVVEMDVQFKALSGAFGFVFNGNGTGTNATSTSTDHAANLTNDTANGTVLTFRNQSGNFCPTWGYYLGDGTQKTMWTATEKAMNLINGTTFVANSSATNGVYRLAYVVNGERLDLFVNGTWVFGFDYAGYDYGTTSVDSYTTWKGHVDSSIKDDSQILMWVQNAESFIDNVKISIPTDGVGVVTDGDTKTLSARTTTYEEDFTYQATTNETYDLTIPSPSKSVFGNTITATVDADTNALNVVGGAWEAHWLVIAGADSVNADNGVMVLDMNMDIESLHRLTLLVNNSEVKAGHTDFYSGIKANSFGIQFTAITEDSVSVKVKHGTGSALSDGETKTVQLSDTTDGIDVRIVANGNKYSVYIEGAYVLTYNHTTAINANSNIALWAEGSATKVIIDDINIYTAK